MASWYDQHSLMLSNAVAHWTYSGCIQLSHTCKEFNNLHRFLVTRLIGGFCLHAFTIRADNRASSEKG